MREELQPLLSAISPEAPSGADLEYDADFARMEKSAQGTSDQEYGSTRIEGTPPDWLDVRHAAHVGAFQHDAVASAAPGPAVHPAA